MTRRHAPSTSSGRTRSRRAEAVGALLVTVALLSSCGDPGPGTNRPGRNGLEADFRTARSCIESLPGFPIAEGPLMLVAGHGYGLHEATNVGLHPPLSRFLAKAPPEVDVLALTGDISRSGSGKSFRRIRAQIDRWPDVLIAPGNHDVGTSRSRAAFVETFGATYGARWFDDTLVIRLDTDLDDWRISGDQLAWLERLLRSARDRDVSSVVVLTHHLIWSKGDRSDFPANGPQRDASIPHDPSQLQSLLDPLDVPVLVISGDVGAFADIPALACDVRGNVKYVASGVGGGVQDNVLLVRLGGRPGVRVCRIGVDDPTDCVARAD